MNALFVPAESLKKRFVCTGVFYRLKLPSGRELRCRNVLNIMDCRLPAQAHRGPVDAMAVMMNPGSSRPLAADDGGPLIPVDRLSMLPELAPVPARPDTTQYQIMRLMVRAGWRSLRVVNLSDIREPKSPVLFSILRELEPEEDGMLHSVFSEGRREEWHYWARLNAGPVVIGWGRDPALEPLARRGMSALNGTRLLGVTLPGHPMRTAHPSPQLKRLKLAWLAEMIRQIPSGE